MSGGWTCSRSMQAPRSCDRRKGDYHD
jgi:hypothetical protein